MVRRGRHEGSITKRADGRWEAKLSLPDGRRKSFYGKTRQEVAKRLTQAQHDLARGLPVVAEKQTVAQYLDNWLAGVKMEIEPRTWRRYHNEVANHIAPVVGNLVLSRLSAQHITNLYSHLREKVGLADSTINLTHRVLSHALSDAMQINLVQRNEAKLAKAPRAKAKEMQPLSEDQANAFLAYLAEQQHRFEALYVLALTTGMRESELLALHWRDIYLDQKKLYVVWNVKERMDAEGHQEWYLGDTKTDTPRSVQLSDLALSALREHRHRQKLERVAAEVWQESDLLFTNLLGGLYKPSALYMQFQQLLKRAGLPQRRFHDLRHTCATILLSRGIPVKQVSEMLGHSDIAITLRIYGHVLPTMHEQAASMMDLVFRRA